MCFCVYRRATEDAYLKKGGLEPIAIGFVGDQGREKQLHANKKRAKRDGRNTLHVALFKKTRACVWRHTY